MSEAEEDVTDEETATPSPGPLADNLAKDGYQRTDSTCPDCDEDDEGLMWYSQNMLVCDTCSYSVDLEARRSSIKTESPWERYDENPPRYHNSGRVRMPGGFLSAYDWVSSDDIEKAVSTVEPDDFYR